MADAPVKAPWNTWLVGAIAGLLVVFAWYSGFMTLRGLLRQLGMGVAIQCSRGISYLCPRPLSLL